MADGQRAECAHPAMGWPPLLQTVHAAALLFPSASPPPRNLMTPANLAFAARPPRLGGFDSKEIT